MAKSATPKANWKFEIYQEVVNKSILVPHDDGTVSKVQTLVVIGEQFKDGETIKGICVYSGSMRGDGFFASGPLKSGVPLDQLDNALGYLTSAKALMAQAQAEQEKPAKVKKAG